MAVTDALSVAFKFLGVASDVYEGKMEGVDATESKYEPKPERWQPSTVMPRPEPKSTTAKIAGIQVILPDLEKNPKARWILYKVDFDAGEDGGKFTAGTFDKKHQAIIKDANSADMLVDVRITKGKIGMDIEDISIHVVPVPTGTDDDLPFKN